MSVTSLSILVAIALLSFPLTAATRKLITYLQVVDIPNERSSHYRPTPKAGGLGLALVVALLLLWSDGQSDNALNGPLAALGMLALLLVPVGLLDDFRGLSPLPRLLIQCIAALALLLSLPSAPSMPIFGYELPGFIRFGVALTWLLWGANLYNFMDGSDGLAALQGIFAGGGFYLVATLQSGEPALGLLPLAIGVACLGFLAYNFPPARIFMGDTGSIYLGFVFAALALVYGFALANAFWLWLILLAGFVADATTTLVTRIAQGDNFSEAHRSHVYQLYIRHLENHSIAQGKELEWARSHAHRALLFAFSFIFCLWQLPLATLVAKGVLPGFVGFLMAYIPMLLGAFVLGAGGHRFFPYGSSRKKHSR